MWLCDTLSQSRFFFFFFTVTCVSTNSQQWCRLRSGENTADRNNWLDTSAISWLYFHPCTCFSFSSRSWQGSTLRLEHCHDRMLSPPLWLCKGWCYFCSSLPILSANVHPPLTQWSPVSWSSACWVGSSVTKKKTWNVQLTLSSQSQVLNAAPGTWLQQYFNSHTQWKSHMFSSMQVRAAELVL